LEIRDTKLDGVKVIVPKRFGDDRGYFAEIFNASRMAAAGLDHPFMQDNESLSAQAGTLRGMHFQAPPHAQAKLVRCVRGAIWDVAVDVRRGSATYGAWVAEELSAANGAQLLVPKGFLHGFVTLEPATLVTYKVDAPYNAQADGSVLWSSLGIPWPLQGQPVLSAKDRDAPAFGDWASPFGAEV
jgi:dTDP-4-dehydrorhamnose 3,5-epimerase